MIQSGSHHYLSTRVFFRMWCVWVGGCSAGDSSSRPMLIQMRQCECVSGWVTSSRNAGGLGVGLGFRVGITLGVGGKEVGVRVDVEVRLGV